MTESARVIMEVTAGVLVGTPMDDLTRRFVITSNEWEHALDQGELLAVANARGQGYAAFLMLQPDRLNWVRTEWIWL